MTQFRTTGCAAFGHPEFTVRFAREVPVPGLERRLLDLLEGEVARGVVFKPGQTVQLGWATLRLVARADGTYGVLEPDLAHELKWVESVDQALLEAWRQQEVLASVGLEARADFPRQALQAVVCARAFEATRWLLGRTEPSAPTDSGWFLGCLDDTHDHQASDALAVVPLVELAARVPPLAQFLALPVGADVVLSDDGGLRARVFLDDEERPPRPGSYLDTFNRPG